MIEDLTLRGAVFLTVLSAMTADDVAPLMTTLGSMHHIVAGDLEQIDPWPRRLMAGRSGGGVTAHAMSPCSVQQPYRVMDPDRHPLDRFCGQSPDAGSQRRRAAHRDPRRHVVRCLLPEGGGGHSPAADADRQLWQRCRLHLI